MESGNAPRYLKMTDGSAGEIKDSVVPCTDFLGSRFPIDFRNSHMYLLSLCRFRVPGSRFKVEGLGCGIQDQGNQFTCRIQKNKTFKPRTSEPLNLEPSDVLSSYSHFKYSFS